MFKFTWSVKCPQGKGQASISAASLTFLPTYSLLACQLTAAFKKFSLLLFSCLQSEDQFKHLFYHDASNTNSQPFLLQLSSLSGFLFLERKLLSQFSIYPFSPSLSLSLNFWMTFLVLTSNLLIPSLTKLLFNSSKEFILMTILFISKISNSFFLMSNPYS